MVMQFSDAVTHAALDAIETAAGTTPTIEFRSGAKPTNCGSADAGTLLATGTLPSDWMAAASGRAKVKAGAWTATGQAAAGGGTAIGHFRIKQGATCHFQGSVTVTGGGGDMTVDNISVANAQVVTVNTFTLNGPAA